MFTIAPFPLGQPTAEDANAAQSILDAHKQACADQIKSSTLACPRCQHEQAVGNSVHITNHWYENPHGCSGGDSYHQSVGQDAYVCHACKSEQRLPVECNSTKTPILFSMSVYFLSQKHRIDSGLSDNWPR